MSANGMEIERKWLVSGLPEGYAPRKHRIVESFYLFANDDAELRISRRVKVVNGMNGPIYGTPKYKWTFKTGNGLNRVEHEGFLTPEDYWDLVARAPAAIYHKDWYEFPMNDGLTLEVNCVDDKWWYAEVEFPSEEAAAAWVPIDYLANCTEVTGEPGYAMKNYYRKQYMKEDI